MDFRIESKRIQFFGVEELVEIRSFPVDTRSGSHEPGPMSTKFPHTLLYVDVYQNEIRWCSTDGKIDKLLTCKNVTDVKFSEITDMCVVEHLGKTLVVIADCYEGLFAFNAETNQKEWSVGAKDLTSKPGEEEITEVVESDEEAGEEDEEEGMYACGITSDDRGYLFVCDTNSDCIHTFTIYGEYQGVALKLREQGLGKPKRIRWCQTLSSLIIAHQENNSTCCISIVRIL